MKQPAGMRLGSLALVGRRGERAALSEAVQAAAGGSGGVLFLVGEAGIGKSRLAREAVALARDAGQPVLRGRATSPSAQLRALREALMSVLRRSGPPADPRLAPYAPALSRLVPEWRLDRPSGPDDSPVVLAEGVLRVLASLGPGGCLAVLEDLHDADADTLAVVDYLVDNLDAEPVLVVATVRSEPGEGLDLVRDAVRRRGATALELTRLDGDEVRQLAAQCLDVPPERVPAPVLDRLLEAADGVPFHVEELLAGMVSDGALARDGTGWRVSQPWSPRVPATLGASVALRADGLGTRGAALLRAAAVLGRRFPASVAGTVAGVAEPDLTACLRAAGEAQLVSAADEPDVYVFRHALAAEALRAGLPPADRVALSGRAARVLEAAYPDRPLVWAHLTAQLWSAAGDPPRAAGVLGAAARRARVEGALSTAIALAEHGLSLVDDGSAADPATVTLREVLLDALVDAGQVDRAVAIGAELDERGAGRAGVHLRLARAAAAAGRWEDGLRQVAVARRLTGTAAQVAELDAIEAFLVYLYPAANRMQRAEALAQRALRAATAAGQAEVTCAALEVLAMCVRSRDLAAYQQLCDRALGIAEEHGLTSWRIRLLFQRGVLDGIHHADPTRLVRAHETAMRSGAVATALMIDCERAMVHLCRGEYDVAERYARGSEESAGRLRLAETRLIALALRVCVAAHRGASGSVDELLARYRALGGEQVDHAAAVWGLGLSFRSLLAEDRDRAWHEVSRAFAREQDRPPHYLSFNRGPYLFLAVLLGKAGREEHDELAASAHGQARWNRQFVAASRAVLEGRAGAARAAAHAVAEFEQLAAPYPLARHLGLRLMAEQAIVDGWGQPREWLSAAETYFHGASAPAVAAACRTLLRGLGVRVPQRRHGSEQIPAPLRRTGVTVREYEVLRLVAGRLGNKEIGERLFLSPRTVEKHVASLLGKTAQPDRAALARYAAQLALAAEDAANMGTRAGNLG